MKTSSLFKSWSTKPTPSISNYSNIPPASKLTIAPPTTPKNFNGLLPLHISSDASPSPTERQFPIDIIAIHGIKGDAYTTWTTNVGKPSEYFWLRDSLPKEVPGARVYSYGYPAAVWFSLETGDLESHARKLLEDIRGVRRSKEEQRRPIVFVCHSMGGIVVKKALNICVVDKDRYSNILASVPAILFLSTPHGGSDQAKFAAQLAKIVNLALLPTSRLIGRVRDDSIAALKRGSKDLFAISRDFRHLTTDLKIYSFVEQKKTMPMATRIVDDVSGSMNVATETIIPMSGCDHRTVCRFDSKKSESYKSVLSILKEAVEEATTKFENEVQEEDIPCLHSLAFPAMHDRLQSAATAHPSTCEWTLHHPSFLAWSSSIPGRDGLLWIKGHPGTGKSTLMAYLHHHFTATYPRSIILDFFFHGNGTALQKSQLGMLRSLVHQLYKRSPAARKAIFMAYDRKSKEIGEYGRVWEWDVEGLRVLLAAILCQKRNKEDEIVLFVDALDEAAEQEDPRIAGELVSYFHEVNDQIVAAGGSTRICISCRHYPVVATNRGLVVNVEGENVRDLARYVEHQLKSGVQGWESEDETARQVLHQAIVTKAEGVFLWTRFRVPKIVKSINDGACSVETAPKLLEAESNDMFVLYEDMLVNDIDISLRAKALLFMQWICLAERPLSVSELRYAMGCDDENIGPDQERCEDSKDFVDTDARMEKMTKSLSGGLAEVRRHGHGTTVQLFHQTATSFLRTSGLIILAAWSDASVIPGSVDGIVGAAEQRLAVSCLNYLSFADVMHTANLQVAGIEARLAFAQYAARFWMVHAERAERKGIMQDGLVKRFFTNERLFETWKLIHFETNSWESHRDSDMIHVASSSNLLSVVEALLESNVPVDELDVALNTPLHHAAKRGHENMVKLLLERGANTEAKNRSGNTPLQVAAANGRIAVTRQLLKVGASIHGKTGGAGDALQAAAVEGSKKLVSILIECGADVNTQSGFYHTALQGAAYGGHHEVVKLLIDHDADLNISGGFHGCALQAAVLSTRTNRHSLVDLFLEYNVDTNVQGGQYGNALQAAVAVDATAIAQLLVANGADVNAHGGQCGTALHAACYNRNKELVKLFLKQGADINGSGGEYGSAIQAAASTNDNEEIIEMLLLRGVDVNQGGGRYGSALQAASASPGAGAVNMLLAHGADINSKGGMHGNVLQAAVYGDNEEVATWYVKSGQDINELGGEHGSVLQASIVSCKDNFIRYLLDKGANTNIQGGKYGNALRAAVFWNREPVVRLLLERGADPNAIASVDLMTDSSYGSALYLAAGKGRLNIVTILLDNGADVNSQQEWSGNALGAAIDGGHREIVELLIQRGANSDLLGKEFGGRFLIAGGNEAMTQILDDHRRKMRGLESRIVAKV